MIGKRLLAAVLAACCLGATAARAQEFPPEIASRHLAVGTYFGTVSGGYHKDTYSGGTEDRQVRCSLSATFNANGVMRLKTQGYFDQLVDVERVPGGYVKRVQTDVAEAVDLPYNVRLSLWATPSGLVQNWSWRDIYKQNAIRTIEIFVKGLDPTSRWRRNGVPETQATEFWCQPDIYWRGVDGKGPGLPLADSGQWPDTYRNRPWLTIRSRWNFQVIQ